MPKQKKRVVQNRRSLTPSKIHEATVSNEAQETTKAKVQTGYNLIDELYFGTAEKTVQESSYHQASLYKPYNPDDLFQKTNDYSIYEEMLQDDQVSVCMNIKKDLVIGSGWDILSGDTNQELIQEDLKRALSEDLNLPFDDQLQELLSSFEFGFAIAEKIFQYRPDGTLSLKCIKARHPGTWLIHTDKHGNPERFEQRGTDTTVEIDPKSVIHYINQPMFQNAYGQSDLRAAYAAWFVKRQIIRYYGIFLEKAASPIPVAKYDANINSNAVDEIYDAIRRFQTKTALVIPKAIELEFLEASNNGEVFIKGINIFNMFIGRSLLIPDLLGFQGSETSGGSYALGKDQIEILFKHIERRRVTLERVVNKEIIQPLIIHNWGFLKNPPQFKLKPISDAHLVELSKLWIEVMKGRVYLPNEEEINHFRALAKFPEGKVNFGVGVQSPEGKQNAENNEEQEEDNQREEINEGKENKSQGGNVKEKNKEQGAERFSDSLNQNRRSDLKAFDLPSGSYQRKVNFKAIESSMDRFKDRIRNEAIPIIQKILQDLFDQIENKRIISAVKPERLDDLKLKHLKDLKIVLKKNLRDAHLEGKLEAQKELFQGNFRTPLPDDKFLEVLEAETFQFIGDWSYNLTKKARVKALQAIKDGLPLSSVIDYLEGAGTEDSLVSIERYSRTKITEVMNRGRLAFFNESGVVAAYQYSAILDDRTTEICEGLNGKIFKAGTEPIPPMHFNCRSLLVPITKYEDFEVSESVGKKSIEQFIEENKGEGFSKK